LLAEWRKWVESRGLGVHVLPPTHIRLAISERVLPAIRNRNLKRMERILAIRDLGRAGFAYGASVLIDLLRDPRDLPPEELVATLESIAGLALGPRGIPGGANFRSKFKTPTQVRAPATIFAKARRGSQPRT
jgi:hypothetical protein